MMGWICVCITDTEAAGVSKNSISDASPVVTIVTSMPERSSCEGDIPATGKSVRETASQEAVPT